MTIAASSALTAANFNNSFISKTSNQTVTGIINFANGAQVDSDTLSAIPVGGTSGQILTKASSANFDYEWSNETIELPTGGSDGQVLAKASSANFDVEWITVSGGGGGLDAIKADASEFIPRTSNGCGIASTESTTNKINRDLLAFDSASVEYAQYWFNWPTGWTTAKVTFFWSASTGTGSVYWAAAIVVFTDGDSTDTGVGTAQSVVDAAASANTLRQSAATSGITPAGTVTAGKRACLQIFRDPTNGSDDMAVDALLEGVLIEKAS